MDPAAPGISGGSRRRAARTSAEVSFSPSLWGKVALITGGARRVGRAIALKLAREGMHIAITYCSSKREADSLVNEIVSMGRRALAIEADLAVPDCDADIHRAFTAQFESCGVLINNASMFDHTPIGAITPLTLDHNFAVNARAPIMLMQRFAPLLAANAVVDEATAAEDRRATRDAGRIINFIDIHVMGQPLRGYMAYNVSKAALMEATMTAALELAPKVTVNAIAPGVVAWAESYTPEQRKQYMKRVPLARPGTPDDATAAALYLIRDADYCTGQIIRLDGGRLYT